MELALWLVFISQLVVIVLGVEILLKAASRVALLLGILPIVIGLTVVSIGTAPRTCSRHRGRGRGQRFAGRRQHRGHEHPQHPLYPWLERVDTTTATSPVEHSFRLACNDRLQLGCWPGPTDHPPRRLCAPCRSRPLQGSLDLPEPAKDGDGAKGIRPGVPHRLDQGAPGRASWSTVMAGAACCWSQEWC
jgi:hypothetical protein